MIRTTTSLLLGLLFICISVNAYSPKQNNGVVGFLAPNLDSLLDETALIQTEADKAASSKYTVDCRLDPCSAECAKKPEVYKLMRGYFRDIQEKLAATKRKCMFSTGTIKGILYYANQILATEAEGMRVLSKFFTSPLGAGMAQELFVPLKNAYSQIRILRDKIIELNAALAKAPSKECTFNPGELGESLKKATDVARQLGATGGADFDKMYASLGDSTGVDACSAMYDVQLSLEDSFGFFGVTGESADFDPLKSMFEDIKKLARSINYLISMGFRCDHLLTRGYGGKQGWDIANNNGLQGSYPDLISQVKVLMSRPALSVEFASVLMFSSGYPCLQAVTPNSIKEQFKSRNSDFFVYSGALAEAKASIGSALSVVAERTEEENISVDIEQKLVADANGLFAMCKYTYTIQEKMHKMFCMRSGSETIFFEQDVYYTKTITMETGVYISHS